MLDFNRIDQETPAINIEEAQRFLTALGCNDNTRFRTFDDAKRGGVIPRCWSAKEFDRLPDANKNGAGVFVVVNETTGDSDKKVTRVRAVFVDLDGAPLEPVTDCNLSPHIVIESSPGRYHAYWKVVGCSLEQFRGLQQWAAGRFNGDKSIVNLSRVMRLPGFIHQKSDPFQTRIISVNDCGPYTVQQIIDGLQLAGLFRHEQHKTKQQSPGDTPNNDYNRRVSWSDVLTPNGWTLKNTTGDGRELWNKPGHAGQQTATVNYAGSDLLYCFSDSAGLPVNEGLSKYAVYTFLQHGGDFKAATKELARLGYGQTSKIATAGTPEEAWPIPVVGGQKNLFVSASDMLSAPVKIEPLLGKVIERGCTGQIFGPSGGGKTFVALDMVCAVGTGGKWNGNQCVLGLVLYFAGEGLSGLRRRVKAWREHNNGADLSNVRISRSVITLDAAGIRKVIVEVRQLEESTGRKVALIVVDTLARHIQGDENSTQDMSEFVQSVDGLRGAFPGSTAIIVHHTGHNTENNNRSRGSSALKAACDFEIQCNKGLLTYTKMKDGGQPEPVEFKLVPVEIGFDEDNEPITSCIVKYGERSAKNMDVSLTKFEKILLSLVKNKPGILSGYLRSEFYDKRRESEPGVSTGTLKNSYLRSFQGLVSKQMIQENGNVIELLSKPLHDTKPSQSNNVTNETNRHKRYTPLEGVAIVTSPVTL